jgi:hypothetical protein
VDLGFVMDRGDYRAQKPSQNPDPSQKRLGDELIGDPPGAFQQASTFNSTALVDVFSVPTA